MPEPTTASANPWIFEGAPYDPPSEQMDPKVLLGFVYIIDNIATGKKYVGKKLFFSSKTKQVKGKKKKTKVESDWRTYYGSSKEVVAEVEKYGEANFVRTILHLCVTKAECNYWELYEQIVRKAILDPTYHNAQVWVRVNRNHLGRLIREQFPNGGK
jgi:hypothetical protein